MKKYLCALLLLSACADGGAPVGPYSYTARNVAKDEYEIVLTGNPGVSEKELKKYFFVHGKKVCGEDKLHLLHGVRDDYNPSVKRHILTGDIDCVATDYFK